MSYLLDTNIVSEGTKPHPNPAVADWLAGAQEDELYLSVISLAEIEKGIARLPDGRRRTKLESWATADVPQRFEGRLLNVDVAVAKVWGRLMASALRRGLAVSAMDGFLAATALLWNLKLVTRNTKDFQGLGVDLLNPWEK